MKKLKDVFFHFCKKSSVLALSAASVIALVPFSVLAEEATTGNTELNAVAITTEDLMPIFNAVSSNMGVILKVGIPLFGLFLVISVVPKVIKHFTK